MTSRRGRRTAPLPKAETPDIDFVQPIADEGAEKPTPAPPPEQPDVVVVRNLRDCPVFSPLTKTNIQPGEYGKLPRELATKFEGLEYVQVSH